jgi:hypothetical protein
MSFSSALRIEEDSNRRQSGSKPDVNVKEPRSHRDIGFSVNHELREPSPIPRPTSIAMPVTTHKVKEDMTGSYSIDAAKRNKQWDISRAEAEAAEVAKRHQRKVSLFDVGGLLDESQNQVVDLPARSQSTRYTGQG